MKAQTWTILVKETNGPYEYVRSLYAMGTEKQAKRYSKQVLREWFGIDTQVQKGVAVSAEGDRIAEIMGIETARIDIKNLTARPIEPKVSFVTSVIHQVGVTHDGNRLHVWIEREDGKEIRMSWSKINSLIQEITGHTDLCFVEIYPPDDRLVDERNRRHFWQVTEMPYDLKSRDSNVPV